MTPADVALFAFTACNTLRVVAYVPQLVKIARDADGAHAISYATWALFGLSHLSTVAYAITALDDWKLAFIFAVNAAACGAILAMTFYKRARYAAPRADRCGEAGGADQLPRLRPAVGRLRAV